MLFVEDFLYLFKLHNEEASNNFDVDDTFALKCLSGGKKNSMRHGAKSKNLDS